MKNLLYFSAEELQEMESLQILGGGNDAMALQGGCLNRGCINKGCAIQDECTGSPDVGCTNVECFRDLLKPQDKCHVDVKVGCGGTQSVVACG